MLYIVIFFKKPCWQVYIMYDIYNKELKIILFIKCDLCDKHGFLININVNVNK